MFELLSGNGTNDNSGLYRCALHALRNLLKNGLTARQKQVIMLYYFKGLDMREISDTLCINISTVSRTIKRGRDRIFSVLRFYFNQ